jgi:hypothetical protein
MGMQAAFGTVVWIVCGLGAVAALGALRAEIRDLVLARNHRRLRHGRAPLDVETEIDRQIAELGCL